MEQTTQQVSQKPSLPIKTKIVAWLMIIINGIFVLDSTYGYYYRYVITRHKFVSSFGGIIRVYLMFLLPIIAGSFLLRKKKWAWWLSLVIIFISIFLPYFGPITLIPLIIFIVFLLDRKNFFKIAS
jgi:hypothetical protein